MQEVRKDLMELHQIQGKMLGVDLYQILYVFHIKKLSTLGTIRLKIDLKFQKNSTK